MALIKCDECGRMISDKSTACPHCGYPTHLNSALSGSNSVTMPSAGATVEAVAQEDTANQSRVVTPADAPARVAPVPDYLSQGSDDLAGSVDDGEGSQMEGSSAPDPRRNERNKLFLFLGVFIGLVIVVGICFIMGSHTSNSDGEGAGEDTTAVAVDVPADTVAAPVQPDATTTPEKKEIKKAPDPKVGGDNKPNDNGEGNGNDGSSQRPEVPGDPSLQPPGSTTPPPTAPKQDDPEAKSTNPIVKLKENH